VLDRAGCLGAGFAAQPGEPRLRRPGAERVIEKLQVLALGTPIEEVVARLDGM